MAATVALFALLCALTGPGVAVASTVWREGAAGAPFHLASTGGTMIGGSPSDQTLMMPFVNAWTAPSSVSPWSVVPFGSNMLVAEPDTNKVRIVAKSGAIITSVIVTGGLRGPRWASPIPGGTRILIADTDGDRVIDVDSASTSGDYKLITSPTPLPLHAPGSAVRTDQGTTLIADTNNDRVIELTADGTLLGRYGREQAPGAADGSLNLPGCAIRLKTGNTVIADTGNDRLVILGRVDMGTVPLSIGSGTLKRPTTVDETPSGNLLVADTGNNRVVEMDLGGQILAVMSTGISAPTSAARLDDESTAIAYGAPGSRQLQAQGPGGTSGTAFSSRLDFGLHGVTKKLKAVSWQGSPTGVAVSYQLNGVGSWRSVPKKGVSLAASFTFLEYKATITGSGTLSDLAFSWDYAAAPAATGGTPFGTGTGLGTGFGPGTGFGTPGGSYVGTGTAVPEALFDNGVRRGWVMESVGTFGTGKLPGPGGVAAQPVTKKQVAGLALLGGMWGIGIALQPIGKLLLALRGMLPFGVISGR